MRNQHVMAELTANKIRARSEQETGCVFRIKSIRVIAQKIFGVLFMVISARYIRGLQKSV